MSQKLDAPSFGLLLRRLRQAAGLTQEGLAERAHLSVRAVSDLERGLNLRPRKDTLALLAEALALNPADAAALETAAHPPSGRQSARDTRPLPAAAVPPLVGRTEELALLERHLGGEGPPLLVLAGEPGIGKSHLLAAAARNGESSAWAVLRGGCQRRGGQEPYAPLLEALERHIHRQSPDQRRAALLGCAWLVRLLPELSAESIEPLPTWTVPSEQERRLVFKAVSRYLANVAGPAGTLLVLDDLQWAGADALDLLAALVRSDAEVPVRVVAAYRDTEAPPDAPLSSMLADLAQAGLALHRSLAPLSFAEVGRLIDQLVTGSEDTGDALREQVAQRTGGVPFFVVSCVQALHLEAGAWQGADAMPWTVAQSVRQRVTALSPSAREVLGIAAVLGRETQLALLAAVATQPEDEVIRALEAAHRLRLLEEGAGAYRFAHDLVREVVEADVGPARRLVLHRRAGEALEARPGEPPAALLAFHYSRSDAPDKASFYLERAGDQAEAQFAHAGAVAHYQELIERLEANGRTPDAPRVREKLGAVLGLEARYAAAIAVLEPAAKHYDAAGDLESLARAISQIGLMFSKRGMRGDGLAWVEPIVARLEQHGQSRGLAQLYLTLSEILNDTDRLSEALTASEHATNLARDLGEPHMRAIAEMRRGNVLHILGRNGDARTVLQDAIPLAEAVGDLQCLNWIYNILAHQWLHEADFLVSLQYIDRALVLAERIGDASNMAFEFMHRGVIAFYSGEWRQARADAEQAAALCRRIGDVYFSGYPFMVLGFVCFGEGSWAQAVGYLEEAAVLSDSTTPEALMMAQSVRAEIDILEGRPEAARTQMETLLGRFGSEHGDYANLLPKLAWAYLELRDLAQASGVAAQAVAFAQQIDDFLNLVEAIRVQALVLMAEKHWAEAEGVLAEILSETQRRCYPWGEARVLDTYGLLHIRAGDSVSARERLEAALSIYARLGARKDVTRIEQELVRLGSPDRATGNHSGFNV
jgi:predicted ATPase/DNA-binding XRE family transcriptional regulator